MSHHEGKLSSPGLRFWDETDQHVAWIAKNSEEPRRGLVDIVRSISRVSLTTFPTLSSSGNMSNVLRLPLSTSSLVGLCYAEFHQTCLLIPIIIGNPNYIFGIAFDFHEP